MFKHEIKIPSTSLLLYIECKRLLRNHSSPKWRPLWWSEWASVVVDNQFIMDRPGLALALGKRKLKFFILPAMRIRNQSLEAFLFRIYYILREGFIKKSGFLSTRSKDPPSKNWKKILFFIWYIGSKKCFYAKKIFLENFSTLSMNIGIHFPLSTRILII